MDDQLTLRALGVHFSSRGGFPGFLRREMEGVGDRLHVGPADLRTTMLLNEGQQINFRPIHPTDLPRMKDLFYNLSQQAINLRFMTSSLGLRGLRPQGDQPAGRRGSTSTTWTSENPRPLFCRPAGSGNLDFLHSHFQPLESP